MAYKIEFLPEAAQEFEALDGALKKSGEPLGNRMGTDLTGYRKMYFGRKAYRIVYEIQRQKVVVLIIGIGKRERAEIYKEVARRLQSSD